MSKQYPGGIVSKTPVTPTSLSAPGIWTMNQQAAAQATNTWPFPRDPQFNYVTMLLHGDGSAGPVSATGVGAGVSSTVTNFNADASTNNFNVTINGDAKSNNFNPYQEGYYSNYFASGAYIRAGTSANLALGSGAWTCESWVFPTSFTTTAGPLWDFRNAGGYISTAPLIHFNTTGTVQYQSTLTSTTAVSLNTWSHIAIVRSGTTVTIYINGVASGTVTDSTTMTNTYCCIGAVNDAPASYYLTAYISNARLVVGTAVYTAAFTPTTSPLTAISGTQFLSCQSNRFVDNSTNAFTLSLTGSPQVSPAQPFTLPSSVATYGSGYFDGTGDYLSLTPTSALNLSTNSWTIEMWVNLNTVSATQVFINFGYEGSTQRSFILYLTSANVLQFAYSTNGSNNTDTSLGASGITTGTWNHLAVVRNSTTITVYRNGVAYGTTITIGASAINYTPGAFRIGFDSSNYINGYMTDCRLVNGTAVYTSAFTPPTSPLTAITNTSLLTTQYNGGGNNSGFKDSSQFNFPITRNGNTTQGTFTPYGSNWSNYFDGSTGYLSMASNAALNFGTGDATVEFWFNGSTASLLYPGIFSAITYNNAGAASIRYNNTGYANKVFMYINTGGDPVIASTSTIAFGVWAHIAIVRQGTSLKLYLNGTLDTTVTISSGLGFDLSNGGTRIGRGFDVDSTNGYFTGYLSNLRAVKGTAVYTSNFTPSTIPLTAITNTSLLTCQSNRFIDNSTNAFTLTVNGSPSVQRFSPFAPLTVYNPTTYGGSAYFDGTSANIITTNTITTVGTQDFCLEAWVYCFSTTSYACIIGSDGAPSAIFIEMGTARGIFLGGPEISLGSAQYNRWVHIVFCRVSNTYAGFVNGVRQATGSLTNNYSTATKIGINNYAVSSTSGYGTTGYIADGRVTVGSSPYSPSSTTITVPTAPLTAVTGTIYLASMQNAAVLDNGMMNDLQTVGNAAVSTSVKKYGAASMYFDGTGDYLVEPFNQNFYFGSGSFTVEFWFNLNSINAYQQLVGATLTSTNGFGGWFTRIENNNKISGWFTSSNSAHSVSIIGTTSVTTGTWYHFAFVRNSNTFTIYLNGTSEATTTNSATQYVSADKFQVGTIIQSGSETNYLNGYIDDLRITKYARYTTTFTVPDQAFPNG